MTVTESPSASGLAAAAGIEELRDRQRVAARRVLGVFGTDETASLRQLVREYGLSYYPLVALGLLFVADTFQSYAFIVLTPEISTTLGASVAAITAALSLQRLAISVAPLPVAALAQQRRPHRALLCVSTGLAWSLMTLFTGFVASLAGLIIILLLDGLSTGSVIALHPSLLVDSYHPRARVRVLSVYNAFGASVNILSPGLVGLLTGLAGLTWRGVFLSLGGTSLLVTLFSIRLRDPGYGHWDTEQLRQQAHEAAPDDDELGAADVDLGFWEICRRMLLVPTNRRLYAGWAIFGILTIPLLAFISFFLDERWNLGPGGRGVFFAFYGACGVGALLVFGRRAERQFSQSPRQVLRTAGWLLAGAVVAVAVAGVMPVFVGVLVFIAISGAAMAMMLPLMTVALMSIVPAGMRPHAQALVAIFQAIGGLAGALLLGGIQAQYGTGATMLAVAIPGVIGAAVIASAGNLIENDLDRMIDGVLEEEHIKEVKRSGGHLPLLVCRGINFSYGQLQVLFTVDFTVDDAEMVALLGVNGAGKSTLLRVISGVVLPSSGTVRLRGQEITYLDAERRTGIGIVQIAGGRAVFGPLTVVENLRTFAFTLRRDRRRVEAAVEECLDAFPALARRRDALASTLSGGEQQMLGLCQALILHPRLLLIDELSLGLAPIVVGQLLQMVRRINQEGTAVVLVEQSINIALNLVHHAYFMEKGQIRFDGRSSDLLARDDLLRAVFLRGSDSVRDRR